MAAGADQREPGAAAESAAVASDAADAGAGDNAGAGDDAGAGDNAGAGDDAAPATTDDDAGPRRPAPATFVAPARSASVPPADSYSLRLVATRKLYDRGTLVSHSPALTSLAGEARLRVNPVDADRLGVADGDRVKASSARGSTTVELERDERIPKGLAALYVNHAGANPADLVDTTAPVTDIRIERLDG
jgi:anaerobic selenocysteine-containing dehydrogenase